MLLFFDLLSDIIFGAPLLILYYQAALPPKHTANPSPILSR
jgi:hypothetical protein